eukprot:438936_1
MQHNTATHIYFKTDTTHNYHTLSLAAIASNNPLVILPTNHLYLNSSHLDVIGNILQHTNPSQYLAIHRLFGISSSQIYGCIPNICFHDRTHVLRIKRFF